MIASDCGKCGGHNTVDCTGACMLCGEAIGVCGNVRLGNPSIDIRFDNPLIEADLMGLTKGEIVETIIAVDLLEEYGYVNHVPRDEAEKIADALLKAAFLRRLKI